MTGAYCKVAVAGAHSTGKSSFVARLQRGLLERGVDAACAHTSANRAKALGFPILAEHTFQSTAWMIAETMQQEMLAALRSKVVLVDRPVPDAVGYLQAALSHTGRVLEKEKLQRLDSICASWIEEYDLVIVTELDPSVPLGADRDTDHGFRVAAGEAIKGVVSRMTHKHFVLHRGQEEGVLARAVECVMSQVSRT